MFNEIWRYSPADCWQVPIVASFLDFLLEGLELLISARCDEHWGGERHYSKIRIRRNCGLRRSGTKADSCEAFISNQSFKASKLKNTRPDLLCIYITYFSLSTSISCWCLEMSLPRAEHHCDWLFSCPPDPCRLITMVTPFLQIAHSLPLLL